MPSCSGSGVRLTRYRKTDKNSPPGEGREQGARAGGPVPLVGDSPAVLGGAVRTGPGVSAEKAGFRGPSPVQGEPGSLPEQPVGQAFRASGDGPGSHCTLLAICSCRGRWGGDSRGVERPMLRVGWCLAEPEEASGEGGCGVCLFSRETVQWDVGGALGISPKIRDL